MDMETTQLVAQEGSMDLQYVLQEIKDLRSELREGVAELREAVLAEMKGRHDLDKKLDQVALKSGFWGTIGGVISTISIKMFGS